MGRRGFGTVAKSRAGYYAHMSSRLKKHKWAVFRYSPSRLIPYDPVERLKEEYCRHGGRGAMPKDMVDNAIRFLPEQIASRAAYDWNARVDVNAGTVQIPLVGMSEIPQGAALELTKQGLALAEDDRPGMSKEEIEKAVASKITQWANISLLYSAGGVVDAVNVRSRS